ncbi:MAG: tRNA (adenosine(37)-N6)-threonylcarbamoyltransferase complex ATPase subunit type 1 TsaE [Phycisphaeraceae bacterium]
MSATLHVESRSIEQTMAVGAAVGRVARAGDVVGLIGELGAGKTQFVRGLALGLGLDPQQVSSPTFVLAHEYEPAYDAAGAARLVLVHIDAYRLGGGSDLDAVGWGDELLAGAVAAVEWADIVRDALGDDWLEVQLVHSAVGRSITLSAHGDWLRRMKMMSCEPLA